MKKNMLTLTRLALFMALATQVTPTLPMLKVATLAQRLVAQKMAPAAALGTRDLSTRDLKGLDETVIPEVANTFTSGAVMAESAYGQNVYSFGNPNLDTTKLQRKLFYLHEGQFRPTLIPHSPAFALNATTLGTMIGFMLKDGTLPESFTKTLRENHRAVTGYKMTATDAQKFTTNVNSSFAEVSAGKVLSIVPRGILGAFAYRKLDTKKQLLELLLAVNNVHPIFKDPNFATDTKAQEQFLESSYTSQETAAFLNQFDACKPEAQITQLAQQPVLSAHSLINEKYYGAVVPPQVIQGSYGFNRKPARPNCVETAFNDFFNCLLFNAQTKTFDMALLKNASPALINFYTNHCTAPAVINKKEVQQEWMNMVSGHAPARYNCDGYEVLPSIQNFVTITNKLAGTTATNLTELAQQLSTPEQTVTMSAKEDEKKHDQTNTITITCTKRDARAITMTLKLHEGSHGTLDVPARQVGKAASAWGTTLRDCIVRRSEHAQAANTFLPLAGEDMLEKPSSLAQRAHCYNSLNIQNPNTRLEVTKNLIKCYKPNDKDHLNLLIQSMPEDGHFKVSIAQDLLQFWHPEHAQRLDSVIRETPEQYKASIVSKFIRNWRPEHAQRLDSIIREAPEQYKASIASEFIRDWRPEHAQRLDSIIREAPEQYKASIASEFIRDWRPEHAQRLDSIIREVPKENSHLIAIAIIKHWRPEHTQRLDSAINEVPKEDTKVGSWIASAIIEHWRPEHAQHLDSILNEVPKEDTKVGVYLARAILVHWRPEHAPHLDFLISKFDTPHPDFLISEWDEHMRKENKKYMTLNIIDLWNSDHAVRFKNIIETLPIDSLEKIYTHTRICNNGAIAIIQEVLKKKSFTSRIKIFFGF